MIKLLLNKAKAFIIGNKVKLIVYAISALLAISGALIVYKQFTNAKYYKGEMNRYKSNVAYYENSISGYKTANRVLRLNRDDLRHSNDSLIVYMEKLKKSLKRAENKPGDVSIGISTSTIIRDTIKIENPTEFKLDTTMVYNEYTHSRIKINKDTLITDMDISNKQSIFIYKSKEYKREYKNNWVRFWHFDWAKEDVDRYEIKNANDKIRVTDTIIYKIE